MKRREFLENGLAAGAGALLAASASARQTVTDKPRNVAMIGLGIQGRNLLNAALKIPNLQFRAVCDIWPYSRRLATYLLKRSGHEPVEYADYRELLDQTKDLDAVIIATPNHCHAEQAVRCLQAGLHVYCERTMAHTIAAAASMVKAMRETGHLLQIGYQRRSNPRYLHVRDRLLHETELFGRITRAQCQWYQPVREDFGWPARFALDDENLQKFGYHDMHQLKNWRDFKRFGGGIFDAYGSPQVDAVGWMLGIQPKAVMAMGSRDFYEKRESCDNITAMVEYETPDGELHADYRVLTTTSGDGVRSCQHLLGTDGSIRMSENPRWTAIYREPHASDWEKWIEKGYLANSAESARTGPATSEEEHVRETGVIVPFELPVVLDQPKHLPHLANFFGAIAGSEELRCPGDTAFVTEVVVHKVQEAVTSGTRIVLKPEDFEV